MLSSEELQILASASIFRDFSPPQLEALLEQNSWSLHTYKRGEQIYAPDHFRKELAVVLSGHILVTKGNGNLVVSMLKPGDLFGAAALFNDESEYVSTLTVRTPANVLFFSQETVQQMVDTQPIFCRGYIRYLSQRVRFLSDKIDTLISSSGEKKLGSWLLSQADQEGNIILQFSMTELAARLNIGRASLYREMQKLEDKGIMVRYGRRIVLLHPEVLDS